jgi:hypothetical protein
MGNQKLDKKFGGLGEKVSTSQLQGLEWDELVYLKDRGKLTLDQVKQFGFRPVQNGGNYEEPSRGRSEPKVESELEEEGYASWTKADLQAEIDNRNEMRDEEDHLSRTGNKDDLVALLEEDDEAEED